MCKFKFVARYYSTYKRPLYFSEIFRTKESLPKEIAGTSTSCKSLKLMLQHGLITSSSSGVFSLMPITVIALERLIAFIDMTMKNVQGQKVLFPTLSPASLWKKSGRWTNPNAQLFKLKDRHHMEYCLGPTHEEVATDILSDFPFSPKIFSLRMYQISSKFRDEMNPKLGLLRGREFIMKDMYTFDISEKAAKETYSAICTAYDNFFQALGVKYVKVRGSSADMGGDLSHEYHFLSDIGEDEVLFCSKCNAGFNSELIDNKVKCPDCGSEFQKTKGIEVGHAFYLGKTYSEPFSAQFKDQDGLKKTLYMGCYGLGITRIIAAGIECLSTKDQIRWPSIIAPFLVSIIPPKKGSKEEKASTFVNFLFDSLVQLSYFSDKVIIDDRRNISIGKRVQDADALGINYSVVSGSAVLQDIPSFEVIDNFKKETNMMTHRQLMEFFCNLNNRLSLNYFNN